MAKKKKNKNQKTRLTKISKKTIKWAAVSAAVLTVSVAVFAQVMFNIYIKQNVDSLSVFPIRSLVREAIIGLIEIKESPEVADNAMVIEEFGIKFPVDDNYTTKANSVIYSYYDWDELEENPGDELEITTSEIARSGTSLISTNMEELFSKIPQAQACARGYKVTKSEFEKTDTLGNDLFRYGTVILSNGETLYIYRERLCIYEDSMDSLGKFLLTAESI
jgi:hypothetical protein